jgi:hypothetical protein
MKQRDNEDIKKAPVLNNVELLMTAFNPGFLGII